MGFGADFSMKNLDSSQKNNEMENIWKQNQKLDFGVEKQDFFAKRNGLNTQNLEDNFFEEGKFGPEFGEMETRMEEGSERAPTLPCMKASRLALRAEADSMNTNMRLKDTDKGDVTDC